MAAVNINAPVWCSSVFATNTTRSNTDNNTSRSTTRVDSSKHIYTSSNKSRSCSSFGRAFDSRNK